MSKSKKAKDTRKLTLEETAQLGPLNVDELKEVDEMIDEGDDDESIAILMKLRLRKRRGKKEVSK